jgi:hypothetical protein
LYGTAPAGLATVNRNAPLDPPATFNEVVTVTVSPGVNAVNGRKLAPRPSESPRNVPLCGPLRDPTTVTGPIRVIGTPRRAIWLCGDATRLPGTGKT